MIKRIRVRGYKSLDGIDVDLAALTVVFGPNAAGKSNLLDALSLLGKLVTADNLDSAFRGHRGNPLESFTLSEGGLVELQRQSTAEFSLTADVELSQAVVDDVEAQIRQAREGLPGVTSRRYIVETRLRYSVTIQIVTASGHLRVVSEKLQALKADWTPKESRRAFLETMGKRIHLRMEKQSHPTYEEIGQDRTVASKPLYPPHYPHLAAFRAELSRWRFYFLEPSAMREEVPLKETESLSPNGDDLAAFYNTLRAANPRQLTALSKTLTQVVPAIDRIDVERTAHGLVRLEVDERGIRLPSRLVSEGTLRVLGLLAVTNPLEQLSLVGYEEPENGVHPSRLATVARLLVTAADRGHTQFIINTHSPVLPELFLEVESAMLLSCRREGRKTRFVPFKSPGPLLAEQQIERLLQDEPTRFRDRVLRGDFG